MLKGESYQRAFRTRAVRITRCSSTDSVDGVPEPGGFQASKCETWMTESHGVGPMSPTTRAAFRDDSSRNVVI